MPPAPIEKPRMHLSPNGRRVQVVIEPRAEVNVSADDVLEQLRTMRCGDWAVLKDAITKLPKLFKSIREPTLVDVAEKRDAQLALSVTGDELIAHLSASPAHGGEPVTQADVLALLNHHHVTYGIEPDVIAAAVANQTADQVIVAHGTAPLDGDDARFESQLPEITDRRPKENSDGSVDYREISMFFTIKPDTLLLRKIPFTLGTAGTAVTGKIIPAKPGRDLVFTMPLVGVKFDAADENILLATIGGQAVRFEHGARVDPVIEQKNVDVSSGNIDFDGTVNVSGATLEAGGNIKVNKGVIGRGELRQDNNSPGNGLARLKARGSVQARCVENALIEARGDVLVDELLAHCEVVAEGAIAVGKDKKMKGHILGGSITAAHGITALVVGSAAGIRTKLEAGISRSLRKYLDQARELIIAKCGERDKLTALLKRSAQLPVELATRTRTTLVQSELEIKNLNTQRDALQQQLGQDIHSRIVIGVRAQEGTLVSLGEKTQTVHHEHGPGTFTLSDSAIVFTPH